MATQFAPGEAPTAPLRGELRYSLELARLMADPMFLRPGRDPHSPPVLLIPGFMAGDGSLTLLAGWLRRRGSRVSHAGMLLNTDCGERAVTRLEGRLRKLAAEAGERVVLIGQSRGGELARVLAVRNPDTVSTLLMLGAPVAGPLDVGPGVLRTVKTVARLGDAGVPGMFSTQCGTGACCEGYRDDLMAEMPQGVRAVSIYSRSDGIVSWRACLDPSAQNVEVHSSHTGMSVNRSVYRVLAEVLDERSGSWNG